MMPSAAAQHRPHSDSMAVGVGTCLPLLAICLLLAAACRLSAGDARNAQPPPDAVKLYDQDRPGWFRCKGLRDIRFSGDRIRPHPPSSPSLCSLLSAQLVWSGW